MGRGKLEAWEAFRWIPLNKISDQVYSDVTRKSAGLPTVLAVSMGCGVRQIGKGNFVSSKPISYEYGYTTAPRKFEGQ